MSYPLVRDLAAEGIPVRLTCGVLGHSRQAYYAWLAQPVSQREIENAYLTNALVESVNTKIRLIARRAFGFHNVQALIGLAQLSLGGYRPQLPT